MSRHRLELWVTIAFGVAAGLALAILSIRTWAPDDWWLRQLLQEAVIDFLTELGDVSGGLIVIIFLLLLGVSVAMTVLLRGFEKLAEIREERKRLRAEARAEGLAEGRAEGRAELKKEWEAWAERLIGEGKLPPDVRFPSASDEVDE